ncbi:MAG: retropepsin-like domain-containing protein, partial [Burkholderiales bacterium]|nr:retropepsin-like domain-containing protein [Burkholderiales bacterium]
GKKFKALLDTGTTKTVVDKKVVAALGITPDEKAKTLEFHGIGQKKQSAYQQQFSQFIIGSEQITQPVFAVADLWANAREDQKALATRITTADEAAIILGMDFLQNYRVLIAASQHKVYLSYVGAPK